MDGPTFLLAGADEISGPVANSIAYSSFFFLHISFSAGVNSVAKGQGFASEYRVYRPARPTLSEQGEPISNGSLYASEHFLRSGGCGGGLDWSMVQTDGGQSDGGSLLLSRHSAGIPASIPVIEIV